MYIYIYPHSKLCRRLDTLQGLIIVLLDNSVLGRVAFGFEGVSCQLQVPRSNLVILVQLESEVTGLRHWDVTSAPALTS